MTKGVWQETIVDNTGAVQPYATVTFRYIDGSLADLYSDPAGTPLIGNPQLTDEFGFLRVYLDPGVRHDITAVKFNYSKTWEDVVPSIEFSIDFGESINAAASKATPVDADVIGLVDSADSNAIKKLSWANLKATLAAYFTPRYRTPNGVIPSNGSDATNDINFSAGVKRDSTDTYNIVAGAMTKRADATWALGTAVGGMAAGLTWAANDWHLHLLGKTSDPAAHDYVFDTSATCVNGLADASVIAAGFNIYKRVGSFRTAGAAWPVFTASQLAIGLLKVEVAPVFQFTKDWSGGADNNAIIATLPNVPGGIQVNAILESNFQDATATADSGWLISSLDQADTAPVTANGTYICTFKIFGGASQTNRSTGGQVVVKTSTARTIRTRAAGSTVDHDASLSLTGWRDSV